MAVSINEICENTKLAREMALMGNYDTSGVYYQGVVQQIHRLLATIADATRKAKWQVVQHQIVEEFEKVKATSNTLQLFKVDTHGERLLGTWSRIDFGIKSSCDLTSLCVNFRNVLPIIRRTDSRSCSLVLQQFRFLLESDTQGSRCVATLDSSRTKVLI